jgi:hypothetical protein
MLDGGKIPAAWPRPGLSVGMPSALWDRGSLRQEDNEPAARRHGRYYPPGVALPEQICAGCRNSALMSGREKCQACCVLEVMAAAPQRAAAYPDLSHGSPGHLCVLPGPARHQAEAER